MVLGSLLRLSPLVVVSMLVVLASSPGCKTNTIDNKTTNTSVAQNVIDQKGGIVTHPSGASVRIPGGALQGATQISIRVAEPDEYPALDTSADGVVYAFEPHGLKLLSSATISLPRTSGMNVERAELGDARWSLVNGSVTFTGTTAEVLVPTFSFYFVTGGGAPDTSVRNPTPAPSGSGGSSGSSPGGTCGLAGMQCCTTGTPCATADLSCNAGLCQPIAQCGQRGTACCTTGAPCAAAQLVCNASQQCVDCGKTGGPCCTTGTPCFGGTCGTDSLCK
jgi:hypothetical protein